MTNGELKKERDAASPESAEPFEFVSPAEVIAALDAVASSQPAGAGSGVGAGAGAGVGSGTASSASGDSASSDSSTPSDNEASSDAVSSDAASSGEAFVLPSIAELEAELERERHKRRSRTALRSALGALAVVAAAAVLVVILALPILQIFGSSMEPTLYEGNVVVSAKGVDFEPGDLVGFYLGNKVLVKRYIAGPGQWVDIDENGYVFVDGEPLDEPYLVEHAFGECDIELPYQVPDGRIFVLGDHRSVSIDSRSTSVGCVANDQIVGKIVFRVWPLSGFGPLE